LLCGRTERPLNAFLISNVYYCLISHEREQEQQELNYCKLLYVRVREYVRVIRAKILFPLNLQASEYPLAVGAE